MIDMSITPNLAPGCRLIKEDNHGRLTVGGLGSNLNSTGLFIAEMLDGKTSSSDISSALCKSYPELKEPIAEKAVESCIIQLWSKGIFLAHEYDELLWPICYMSSPYRYLPSFCEVPEYQIAYLTPALKRESFSNLKSFAEMGAMEIYIAGSPIENAVVLLGTPCPNTYTLIAICGESSSVLSGEALKDAIRERQCLLGTIDQSDAYALLANEKMGEKSTCPLVNTGIEIARLSGEFDSGDMSIIKVML